MAVGIRLERLSKLFGTTRAVDQVNLEIEPGELFFLLGPSGCGKTTLLRCIAGFHTPDEGAVYLGSREITHLPPHQRDTGMVFQSYALWPHMTVAQNVAFGLEMRKFPKADVAKRVAEALSMVRMSDRANYKPNQLSGGQQQRVALARALVIHPQCLLLDEPLSNLDAKLRLEMRAEIRRICKQAELTAVYVTHDQKEALSIADRLAILDHGTIQQCGPPLEVYRRPVSTFVAGFMGESNFLQGTVAARNGEAAEVVTPVGRITSSLAPEGLRPGEAVTVSLRPEVVHVGTPPAGVPNVLRGLLHDTIYLGEVAQHQLTLSTDGNPEHALDFKVFELNPKMVARENAEPVEVWFHPHNVVLLRS